MVNLHRASQELFRRAPDECFPSLSVLRQHCQWQRDNSQEIWQPPRAIRAAATEGMNLVLTSADEQARYQLNDWSFSQLCRLAGVTKETVNRLSADTAALVFQETLPQGNKPLQFYSQDSQLRSIHAASYTRLHNIELLAVVEEFASDFQQPPQGFNGATGLYGGEQDMFCFLIDPTGWVEIEGESFAPGFFLWNSEVGCRSVGVETFWYQQICANHIVWDAIEVVEFSRKHTANVREALNEVRRIIESLVLKRDARKDTFTRVIQKAMQAQLGNDAEEVQKLMGQNAIPRSLAREAIAVATQQGRFTVFSMVDALTRLTGKISNAGERTVLDQKVAGLLTLVA
jgi:hypothetical protein